jgi:hypothetical protein
MLNQLTTTNDREVFFKVYEQDIIGACTGIAGDNYKMLTRGDGWSEQDALLSIVNTKYRVVENEEILMPMQHQMINHFDPAVLENIKIKDHIAKNGAVCYSEYILPRMQKEVETDTGHKTNIGLRFVLKNTFDGSSSVVFYGGVIDFFCTNGMILGDYDVTRRRHTKNFNVDGFISAFDNSIERHQDIVMQYQRWADKKIYNTDKVVRLFRKLTTGSEQEPKKKNGLSGKLFAQYIDEANVRGNNIFSLVSSMTHYASHDDDRFPLRSNSDSDSLFKRQETVRKWLNSNAFADYLEAA